MASLSAGVRDVSGGELWGEGVPLCVEEAEVVEFEWNAPGAFSRFRLQTSGGTENKEKGCDIAGDEARLQ